MRFKELRKQKHLTQDELVSRFNTQYGRNYSQVAISQFENDKRTPETSALIDFADFFGVSVDYLLGVSPNPHQVKITDGLYADKDMEDETVQAWAEVQSEKEPEPQYIPIPILGRVAAGHPIPAIENWDGEVEYIRKERVHNERWFALRIYGDSMYPDIQDGDVVIVRPQEDVEPGQIAIVLINGEDATCKQVFKRDDGLEIVGFNRAVFAPRKFTADEIATLPVRIIGRVMQTRRNF